MFIQETQTKKPSVSQKKFALVLKGGRKMCTGHCQAKNITRGDNNCPNQVVKDMKGNTINQGVKKKRKEKRGRYFRN